MKKNYHVTAVVVAFNNECELESCIEGLENQTYKVSCIIIVDNSDDEHALENQKVIDRHHEVLFLYERNVGNTGSAGGYAKGMKVALTQTTDFIWLNDQDGIPVPDCLSNLIAAFEENGRVPAVFCPKVVDINDGYELKSFRQSVNCFNNTIDIVEKNQNLIRIRIAGTTGVCIHAEIPQKIGVYNDKVFFVGNEDYEYSFRTYHYGYELILVSSAYYRHPDLQKKYKEKTRWISQMPISYQIRPMNLGVVDSDSVRTKKNCAGRSYNNYVYSKQPYRIVNFIYSVIRLSIVKCINKKIRYRETWKCYLDGMRLGKETRKRMIEDRHKNRSLNKH